MIFVVLSKSDEEKLLGKSIYYLRSITQNVENSRADKITSRKIDLTISAFIPARYTGSGLPPLKWAAPYENFSVGLPFIAQKTKCNL